MEFGAARRGAAVAKPPVVLDNASASLPAGTDSSSFFWREWLVHTSLFRTQPLFWRQACCRMFLQQLPARLSVAPSLSPCPSFDHNENEKSPRCCCVAPAERVARPECFHWHRIIVQHGGKPGPSSSVVVKRARAFNVISALHMVFPPMPNQRGWRRRSERRVRPPNRVSWVVIHDDSRFLGIPILWECGRFPDRTNHPLTAESSLTPTVSRRLTAKKFVASLPIPSIPG